MKKLIVFLHIFVLSLCIENKIIVTVNVIKKNILYSHLSKFFFTSNKASNIDSYEKVQRTFGSQTVKIIWNYALNNLNKMFYECKEIISVDFLEFDTSKVINMNNMFYSFIQV